MVTNTIAWCLYLASLVVPMPYMDSVVDAEGLVHEYCFQVDDRIMCADGSILGSK